MSKTFFHTLPKEAELLGIAAYQIVDANGKVTGVGPGTATITATTSKGAYATIDIIVSGNTGKSPTLKSTSN